MMFNKLRVIWKLYVNRRANWVMLLVGVLFFALSWTAKRQSTYRRVAPQKSYRFKAARLGQRSWRYEGRKRGVVPVDEWDWSEWDAENEVLFFSPMTDPSLPDPWGRIAKMRNLRQLRMGGYRSSGQEICRALNPIARLTQLEYLELPGIPFSEDSVTPWKTLKQLEWLVATKQGISFEGGLESLPVFPSLHTLEVQLQMLTPEAAAYLVLLPNLQTLIVNDQEDVNQWFHRDPAKVGKTPLEDPMTLVSPEAIRILAKSKSLAYVYVAGRDFAGLEDFVIANLPNVNVHPLYVNGRPFSVLCTSWIAAVVLSLIPAFAVFGQLTRPESLLTPGYARPHLVFAGLCISTAIAISVVWAATVVESWAVVLATTIAVVGFSVFLVRPKKSNLMILLAVPWLSSWMVDGNYVKIWLRGFLRGEHGGGIALGLAVAGVFLFIMWMRNVIVFHRINAERGVHFAVLTLKDMGLVNQLVFANQATQWTKSFLFPKDAELRTSIQRYRRTDSISRRRLFAMPSSAPTTWIVVIYTLLYLASFVFGYFNFGAVRFDGQSLMVLVLAMFAVAVAVVAVNGQWFARRVSFASELCRPTRRREFVDDVFSAAGLAVARPVVAICLIQVLFGAFSVSGLVNGLLSGVSVGVLLIGLAVLLYSLSMWGLTVEQDWMLVVITAGAFFGILAVVPFVSVLSYALGGKGMTLHPAAPAVVGLPLFLIGCVICALARSRWNRFEFARLV